MPFVASCVKLLHTVTAIKQRRYVPGELNPADIALRGISPDRAKCADMWFDGPSFLRNTAERSVQPVLVAEIIEDDPEVKKNPKRCGSQQVDVKTGLSKMLARYSSLSKL